MSKTINPYDMVPKYYQLANIIRKKIEEGNWQPRTPIPSERQLETQYNVSRTTIRQAIDHLEKQGFLYREHGRGTFVSPHKLQKGIQELTSFSEDMQRRGIKPGQVIQRVEFLIPPADILQVLEQPAGTRMLCIERIRLGDEQPMGLQLCYLTLTEEQKITREELEERGSLYLILQEKFNILPTEADETLEISFATPEQASLLQVKPGAPLLLNERILYNQNRKPVEYVRILYRSDRFRYSIRLTR
ncbi:MAG: GntR family transcriptional regulator [Anaerolineaceae bacterium]|nr:GntR family transcriptional regulator [Anaerolineaceae bacterium]